MRTTWRVKACLWTFGMIVLLSNHAQADSVGPYYATPSWDQTFACSTRTACTRFITLSNFAGAAVLDRETGQVWEKTPDATLVTWSGARDICANKNVGGRKGWRLPSLPELASLIDPSVADPGPTLPPGHPFQNVPSGQNFSSYWTATTDVVDPAEAWGVFFFTGNVTSFGKDSGLRAWCVRGGMNADAY